MTHPGDMCDAPDQGVQARPERKERSLLVAVPIDIVAYAGYYLANILFLLLSLPFALLLAPVPGFKKRIFLRVAHTYAHFLTRVYLPFLGVCRVVEVSGVEHCPSNASFICVANHRGRLDALLLTGVLANTAVVIKAKHAKFPMLAHLVRHCGFVSVDQASAASITAALRKCGLLLAAGTNLLVFPEGARTTGARLRRFGSMAFKVAIDQGIPILPAVVHPESPFMGRRLITFFPRKPVRYRIRFLPVVFPGAADSAAELCDRVHRCMASELKVLDRGTEWERVSA